MRLLEKSFLKYPKYTEKNGHLPGKQGKGTMGC